MNFQLARRCAAIGVTIALCLGCGDTLASHESGSNLEIVSGSDQSGQPTVLLSRPLVVRALSSTGAPRIGIEVKWKASEDAVLSDTVTHTDANGETSVRWLLPTSLGLHTVSVKAASETGNPRIFIATNGATISGFISLADEARLETTAFASSRVAVAAKVRNTFGFTRAVLVGWSENGLVTHAKDARDARGFTLLRELQARFGSNAVRKIDVSPGINVARVEITDPVNRDSVVAAPEPVNGFETPNGKV